MRKALRKFLLAKYLIIQSRIDSRFNQENAKNYEYPLNLLICKKSLYFLSQLKCPRIVRLGILSTYQDKLCDDFPLKQGYSKDKQVKYLPFKINTNTNLPCDTDRFKNLFIAGNITCSRFNEVYCK